MPVSSRQAIGALLVSIFASGCLDAPTRLTAPGTPNAQVAAEARPTTQFTAAAGNTLRTLVGPDGRVHEFTTKHKDRTVHLRWRIDGKLNANTVSHLAADGSVERITGTVDRGDGKIVSIDHRIENGKPVGEITPQLEDYYGDWQSCIIAMGVVTALSIAIGVAATATPVNLVTLLELIAAYGVALDWMLSVC